MTFNVDEKSPESQVLWRTLTVRKTKVLIKKKYSFPIFVGNSLGKDEQVTVSANRKGDTLLMSAKTLSVVNRNTKVYRGELPLHDKN